MPLGVTWAILSLLAVALQLLGPCAAPAADSSAQFDLLVQGGRVIDPESGLDGVRDIGLRDGPTHRTAPFSMHGYLRIVDESGEDYGYAADRFFSIEVPKPLERALLKTAS